MGILATFFELHSFNLYLPIITIESAGGGGAG